MAKYIERAKARLGRNKIAESNILLAGRTMKLCLEDAENNVENELIINKGSQVILGAVADENGEANLAINTPSVIAIISDEELQGEIINALVSAEELTDVNFVNKAVIDAALDGLSVEDIVVALADGDLNEANEIEVATVSPNGENAFDVKVNIANNNVIEETSKKVMRCEEVGFADDESEEIVLNDVELEDTIEIVPISNYEEFKDEVNSINGTVQLMDDQTVAINNEGKVVGYINQETGEGAFYPQNEFDNVDEMNAFIKANNEVNHNLIKDAEWEANLSDAAYNAVNDALKAYESSEMTFKDLAKLESSLAKVGIKESAALVNSFVRLNKESKVAVVDLHSGKMVRAFAESAELDCDNFIAEGPKGRFAKRYIA